MKEKALAQKILLLGMDGMDPRFTMRMLKKGKMPNVQRLLDKGAANKDLAMRGGHPTITPPMWTTLETGRYANVYGITQFYRKAEDIDALYNYRDPETGKCIVSIALRNKDAAIVGLGGPDCGDIIYFNEEGFNFDHGDGLTTSYGEEDKKRLCQMICS